MENPQISRIEKAIELTRSGAVTPWMPDLCHVSTKPESVGYLASTVECSCPDFKGSTPCAHIWAAIGTSAAFLISRIHGAASLAELEAIRRKYSDHIKNLRDAFYRVTLNEYRSRHCELTSKARMDEENAVLVKSQPKSNGRCDGIEI